ncbi:hypothetical protein [Sediminicola luteus]|uniref:Lipoprotein n=1 Tax=Sediminicola luteus TaxID=319238 RepID=A0A2A4GD04_9FLAO|nr:hypothetical protein [Sediminicola luteus]PCE66301.1 hypothetical protein B7P33_03100 [Sediminicola luteus]
MHLLRLFRFFAFSLLFLSIGCQSDDDNGPITLASLLQNQQTEEGGVIACAASADLNQVFVFYYPEAGADNIRYFESPDASTAPKDWDSYSEVILETEPVFNGYLGRFVISPAQEKWVVVTFEKEGVLHFSNPIRLKQNSQPTVWHDQVSLDKNQATMPRFEWAPGPDGLNAIFFQVVTNAQNDLLSGTYTYDSFFRYYDTSNVVLNVTTQSPPQLQFGNTYGFTLMAVSLDNWVNTVIEKEFTIP